MTPPAIRPGEILKDELEEIGISLTELARQIDVPANRISRIVGGKRNISGDTAPRPLVRYVTTILAQSPKRL